MRPPRHRFGLFGLAVLGLAALLTGCAARGRPPLAYRAPPPPAGAYGVPPLAASARAAAESARQLLGVPYRLGGDDPRGFDCSGLVTYTFGLQGVKLPRTVPTLFAVSQPVPRAAIADLLPSL